MPFNNDEAQELLGNGGSYMDVKAAAKDAIENAVAQRAAEKQAAIIAKQKKMEEISAKATALALKKKEREAELLREKENARIEALEKAKATRKKELQRIRSEKLKNQDSHTKKRNNQTTILAKKQASEARQKARDVLVAQKQKLRIDAAVKIQCLVRGTFGRKHFQKVKRNVVYDPSATKIQKIYRGYYTRRPCLVKPICIHISPDDSNTRSIVRLKPATLLGGFQIGAICDGFTLADRKSPVQLAGVRKGYFLTHIDSIAVDKYLFGDIKRLQKNRRFWTKSHHLEKMSLSFAPPLSDDELSSLHTDEMKDAAIMLGSFARMWIAIARKDRITRLRKRRELLIFMQKKRDENKKKYARRINQKKKKRAKVVVSDPEPIKAKYRKLFHLNTAIRKTVSSEEKRCRDANAIAAQVARLAALASRASGATANVSAISSVFNRRQPILRSIILSKMRCIKASAESRNNHAANWNAWRKSFGKSRSCTHRSKPIIKPTQSFLKSCIKGDLSAVQFAIANAKGKDPDENIQRNDTLQNRNVVKLVNSRDFFFLKYFFIIHIHGRCALSLAAASGKLLVVSELLKYKVDAYSRDDDGNTPLHYCFASGDEVLIRFMLAKLPFIKDIKASELRNNLGHRPMSVEPGGVFSRALRIQSKQAINNQRIIASRGKINYSRLIMKKELHAFSSITSSLSFEKQKSKSKRDRNLKNKDEYAWEVAYKQRKRSLFSLSGGLELNSFRNRPISTSYSKEQRSELGLKSVKGRQKLAMLDGIRDNNGVRRALTPNVFLNNNYSLQADIEGRQNKHGMRKCSIDIRKEKNKHSRRKHSRRKHNNRSTLLKNKKNKSKKQRRISKKKITKI